MLLDSFYADDFGRTFGGSLFVATEIFFFWGGFESAFRVLQIPAETAETKKTVKKAGKEL